MAWERMSEGMRTLPVALTDAQMAEVGHELGELHAKITDAEEHRSSVMRDLKAGIDAQRASATKMALTLASRTRNDNVPVRADVNFAENAVRIVRLDTDEVVETRALTVEEREKLSQKTLTGTPPATDLAAEPRKTIRRRKGQAALDSDGLPENDAIAALRGLARYAVERKH